MVCGSNSIVRHQFTTKGAYSLPKHAISPYNPPVSASHVKIGFLALCLALAIGLPSAWIAHEQTIPGPTTTIAFEHTAPATIRIARLVSSGTNVFEIGANGSGSIAVHLPSSWKRQEVRDVPLASVTAEPQAWDYVRWALPSGGTVRFDAPNPGTVTVQNPSGIPLTVRSVRVDTRYGTREEDAMIMTVDPLILP